MVRNRMALPATRHAQLSDVVCRHIVSLITGVVPPLLVAGYIPIRAEVNIVSALELLSAHSISLCLPAVTKQNDKLLQFRSWHPYTSLEKDAMGIACPASISPTVEPTHILVPLVGFTRDGYRLGYGGGYYDYTLRHLRMRNPSLHAIGIAFDFQEMPEFVAHAGDERLNSILTPQEKIILL